MCWTLISREAPNERIATKDIVVFKYVDIRKNSGKAVISPSLYNDKLPEYILGKTYSLKKKLKVETHNNCYSINDGFHSYVYNGSSNVVCVIPKGAKYYYNGRYYVSTSIKLLRIMQEIY